VDFSPEATESDESGRGWVEDVCEACGLRN